ncbi:hypothetical protein [Oryzibacter oryziterrae]|uniref:hypothetical protein n=1 Tax=Oryzibacter oryziterrae TaxID=2766474 RepID=UPI001F1BE20A|nr:hypothetical protein [Oryzibacter oryziterrae]
MSAPVLQAASSALAKARGGIVTAGASIATAMSGAGATCANGACGQGCGYACGIIGTVAALGIAGTALKRKLTDGSSAP